MAGASFVGGGNDCNQWYLLTNYVEPSFPERVVQYAFQKRLRTEDPQQQMICAPASSVVQRHYDMCRRRPRFLTQLKHRKMWKHVEDLEKTATCFLQRAVQKKV